MSISNITHENLSHFWGSEQLFFHPLFRGIHYTEGVRFLNNNGAGWLIEMILGTILGAPKHAKKHEFIHVRLWVNVTSKIGTLKFDDGNGKVFYSKDIEYTDFPLPEISFYIENNVMMLPSER